MPRRCVCCSLPPEPGSASRVKRWRSAHYEPMTDRNQQRGTTTSCWRTIRSVGWCNERRDGSRATGHEDRKSTRLNSSHTVISYAVFCLKKKKRKSKLAPAVDEE